MRKPFRLSSRFAVGRRGTSPLEFTSSKEENARIAIVGSLSALRRIGMTGGASLATQFHDGPLD